jgi:PRTRC genetic system protein C
MSNLKAEALLREFHYKGIRIPDPGPDLTVEQVRDLLIPNYPEIATGQGQVQLYAESETKFFPTLFPAEIEFFKDDQGKVTHLVLHQNGHDMTALKK